MSVLPFFRAGSAGADASAGTGAVMPGWMRRGGGGRRRRGVDNDEEEEDGGDYDEDNHEELGYLSDGEGEEMRSAAFVGRFPRRAAEERRRLSRELEEGFRDSSDEESEDER